MNDRHQIPAICGGCGSPALLITALSDGQYGCCPVCRRLQEVEVRANPATQLCDNCAFRPGSPERADPWGWMRLTEAFEHGQPFHCHKGMTAELTGDGDLRYLPGADVTALKPCAGWLAWQKAQAARTCDGPALQIAERSDREPDRSPDLRLGQMVPAPPLQGVEAGAKP